MHEASQRGRRGSASGRARAREGEPSGGDSGCHGRRGGDYRAGTQRAAAAARHGPRRQRRPTPPHATPRHPTPPNATQRHPTPPNATRSAAVAAAAMAAAAGPTAAEARRRPVALARGGASAARASAASDTTHRRPHPPTHQAPVSAPPRHPRRDAARRGARRAHRPLVHERFLHRAGTDVPQGDGLAAGGGQQAIGQEYGGIHLRRRVERTSHRRSRPAAADFFPAAGGRGAALRQARHHVLVQQHCRRAGVLGVVLAQPEPRQHQMVARSRRHGRALEGDRRAAREFLAIAHQETRAWWVWGKETGRRFFTF